MFIKDISHYLIPPNGDSVSIAPSIWHSKKGVGTTAEGINPDGPTSNDDTKSAEIQDFPSSEPGNPTILPRSILEKFHFTFLIRHPQSSVPSYYRCTAPPLDKITGFGDFMPNEVGYKELRALFDYLIAEKLIGPGIANRQSPESTSNGSVNRDHAGDIRGNGISTETVGKVDICVIDADDLLEQPQACIEAYCRSVGVPYDLKMLNWDNEDDQEYARQAFAKWKGFHDDALHSTGLISRSQVCNLPSALEIQSPSNQRLPVCLVIPAKGGGNRT